ncbi:hypothetical protein PV416_44430, partial [Streptomyces ipomoeae]|nr:hypothetical protein [Streptomyces ipomoeae]
GAPGEWVRAVGYPESVAGVLDRWVLDGIVPDRPVRVQHSSGAMWFLNSAAGGRPDGAIGGDSDGRFWREDERLRGRVPPVPLCLARVGLRAARLGVTGFTNADPSAKLMPDDPTLPIPTELAAAMAAVRPGRWLCTAAPACSYW